MFTPELVNVFTASAGICPIVEFNISVRTSFSRAICTFSSAFLAAAAFFKNGTTVTELQQANTLLQPLLGNNAAVIFAVALLFAGVASTITSGMAAGSIFAGIYREPYDIQDTHSRWGVLLSLIAALLIIMVVSNPFMGLIYSQMILSIQLPITIFLQVYLTSSEKVMGKYKNRTSTKWILYFLGGIVTLLNLMLLISFF